MGTTVKQRESMERVRYAHIYRDARDAGETDADAMRRTIAEYRSAHPGMSFLDALSDINAACGQYRPVDAQIADDKRVRENRALMQSIKNGDIPVTRKGTIKMSARKSAQSAPALPTFADVRSFLSDNPQSPPARIVASLSNDPGADAHIRTLLANGTASGAILRTGTIGTRSEKYSVAQSVASPAVPAKKSRAQTERERDAEYQGLQIARSQDRAKTYFAKTSPAPAPVAAKSAAKSVASVAKENVKMTAKTSPAPVAQSVPASVDGIDFRALSRMFADIAGHKSVTAKDKSNAVAALDSLIVARTMIGSEVRRANGETGTVTSAKISDMGTVVIRIRTSKGGYASVAPETIAPVVKKSAKSPAKTDASASAVPAKLSASAAKSALASAQSERDAKKSARDAQKSRAQSPREYPVNRPTGAILHSLSDGELSGAELRAAMRELIDDRPYGKTLSIMIASGTVARRMDGRVHFYSLPDASPVPAKKSRASAPAVAQNVAKSPARVGKTDSARKSPASVAVAPAVTERAKKSPAKTSPAPVAEVPAKKTRNNPPAMNARVREHIASVVAGKSPRASAPAPAPVAVAIVPAKKSRTSRAPVPAPVAEVPAKSSGKTLNIAELLASLPAKTSAKSPRA